MASCWSVCRLWFLTEYCVSSLPICTCNTSSSNGSIWVSSQSCSNTNFYSSKKKTSSKHKMAYESTDKLVILAGVLFILLLLGAKLPKELIFRIIMEGPFLWLAFPFRTLMIPYYFRGSSLWSITNRSGIGISSFSLIRWGRLLSAWDESWEGRLIMVLWFLLMQGLWGQENIRNSLNGSKDVFNINILILLLKWYFILQVHSSEKWEININ